MLSFVSIKEVKEVLGNWCKLERQRHQLTQSELAEILGMSRYTIQKFETGNNATLDTALKIAHHFDALDPLYKALKQQNEQNQTDSLY
ncbi:helix-turn-helix transcriptional regulator [uncultured Christiangramia sp.]|uniref:helix-turn-helix transcriptional regulator n=1 Tax=Christiangramia sp. 3-2217-3z TaxID=3417564 RepID=UPI00261B63F0|nr:helix-turn-helix transcriptional regulator [uncultured Christiangramia sp.]